MTRKLVHTRLFMLKVIEIFAEENGTAAEEASDLLRAITGTMNECRRRAADDVLRELDHSKTGVISEGDIKYFFSRALSGCENRD